MSEGIDVRNNFAEEVNGVKNEMQEEFTKLKGEVNGVENKKQEEFRKLKEELEKKLEVDKEELKRDLELLKNTIVISEGANREVPDTSPDLDVSLQSNESGNPEPIHFDGGLEEIQGGGREGTSDVDTSPDPVEEMLNSDISNGVGTQPGINANPTESIISSNEPGVPESPDIGLGEVTGEGREWRVNPNTTPGVAEVPDSVPGTGPDNSLSGTNPDDPIPPQSMRNAGEGPETMGGGRD